MHQSLVNGCRLFFAIIALMPIGARVVGAQAVLRSAIQIRSLSAEQADERHAAELIGVVLGQAEPYGESLVLWDETDSIYVTGDAASIGHFVPGDLVELKGHTISGDFAPVVRVMSASKIGTSALPEPRDVGSDDLFTKGLDAQWVVVSGVVRDLRVTDFGIDPARPGYQPGPYRVMLTLAVGDRYVSVQVCNQIDPKEIVDAEVELRGICFNLHNAERQFLRPLILVPQGIDIRIKRPPPAGPFEPPPVSSRSLLQFRPEGLSMHRVRVDGVVLHQVIGVGLWIRDERGGLFVRTAEKVPLRPGDLVRVAGFPERGEFSPILAHAIYEKAGESAIPLAVRLSTIGQEIRHHDDLVEIEGELLGRRETAQGMTLYVRSREATVEVICDGRDPAWQVSGLEVGCSISAVGICRLVNLEHERPPSGVLMPDKFSLLARVPADIAITKRAPWWTPGRVAALLIAIIATLAAILVAVSVVSRRRLNRERARRALEVSAVEARLAERSQLARDLHDTLAQGLGAISLQLDLAGSYGGTAEPGGWYRHISIAHELVRTSILEVRSFIRNLRTQTQQDMQLDSVIRDLLSTAVEGSEVRTDFRIEGDGWKLESGVKEQVTRLAQEAIANAIRHSDGTELIVSVRYEAASLVVIVDDNGKGFSVPDSEKRLHFGLLGMRERAQLIGADLAIESTIGRGTRVVLTVPRNAVLTDSLSI